MGLAELLVLAAGLSMDAFAVAICKGLSIKKASAKDMATVGLWFGFFQAAMPLVGFFLGIQFSDKIVAIDHWIAFVLLAIIGINMIREAVSKDDDKTDSSLSFAAMLPLAVATSIDALAIGVTFAFLNVNIWLAVTIIGAITFVISAAGVKIGNIFGTKYKSKAELFGGLILCAIGLKILIEHLFF